MKTGRNLFSGHILEFLNQFKGDYTNAINIPLTELLSKETLESFDNYVRDTITIVLYANNQTEANGSWMLLKQLGYSDILVLLGGYECYSKEFSEDEDIPEIPEYYVETPKYDFAQIMLEASSNQITGNESEIVSEPIIPIRKKKKTVVEGGC